MLLEYVVTKANGSTSNVMYRQNAVLAETLAKELAAKYPGATYEVYRVTPIKAFTLEPPLPPPVIETELRRG